jgi:hypothetical protein
MSFEISTLSKPTFRAIEPPNPRTFSHLRWTEYLVAQIFPRWNPLTSWMRQIEDFQMAA